MSKIKANLYCFSFSICLILVALFFGLFEDHLLHHSDWKSFAQYQLALALFGGLILTLSCMLFMRLTKLPSKKVTDFFCTLGAALLFAAALIFTLEWLDYRLRTLTHLLVLLGSLTTAFFLDIRRTASAQALMVERISRLFIVLSLVGIGLFALLTVNTLLFRPLRRHLTAGEARHVVLLIIDHYPAFLLNTYNPERPRTGFDEIAKHGLVFDRARTNTVWTHGFHSALYTGKTLGSFYKQNKQAAENNLLKTLQDHDVTTRWITFHNNGIPEGTKITDYHGLRSMYLSEVLAFIPRWLGMEYNVFTTHPDNRGLEPREREKAVLQALNFPMAPEKLITDFVFHEARQLQSISKRSYLSFHIDFSMNLPDRFDEFSKNISYLAHPPDKLNTLLWEACIRSETFQAERMGRALQQLVEKMRARGMLENTLVIVTADHGINLKPESYGYQIHPDEESMRVPLVLLGKNLVGRDSRLVETVDLTQTILDHANVNVQLEPRAQSLLQTDHKKRVVTATYSSPTRNTWFFNVYKGHDKYVVNVHAQGDASIRRYSLDTTGFVETLQEEGPHLLEEIRGELGEGLLSYSLDNEGLHENFAPSVLLGL